MNDFLKAGLVGLGMMTMVMACEPGDGSTGTADQGTTGQTEGATEGVPECIEECGEGMVCGLDESGDPACVPDEGGTTDGAPECDEECGEGMVCGWNDDGDAACVPEEGGTTEGGTACEGDEECVEGQICGSSGYCESEGEESFDVLEIEDDPENPTLSPCDKGNLKSPGADIDAAELVEADEIVATLTNCQLTNTSTCESTADDSTLAEGGPDGTGKEETGTYVALNGGLLRCEWSDGVKMTAGQVITVYEIGGTGSTIVEQYTVRMCKSLEGNCTQDSNYASGKVEFETDSFF
jgi:hypothetical protein